MILLRDRSLNMEEITDPKMMNSIRYFIQKRPLFPVDPHMMYQVSHAYETGISNLIHIEVVINSQFPVKLLIVKTGNEVGGIHTFLDFVLADWRMIHFVIDDMITSRLREYNAGHDPWFRGRK